MRLIIIRHATAVPHGTPGYADEDRPLTPEGEAKFREAARGLARAYDRPDALLTSPWLRARQTAAIAGAAWKIEPQETKALAGGSFEEQARAAETRGQTTVARAARRERLHFLREGRRLHGTLVEARPADLALRALEAMGRGRRRVAV